MKMNEHRHISSLLELDQAIRDSSLRLKAKECEIKEKSSSVRDDLRGSFSGVGLLANGVRRVSKYIPLDVILLAGAKLLRRKLLKRR